MTGCRPHGKNGGFFWQRTFKRFTNGSVAHKRRFALLCSEQMYACKADLECFVLPIKRHYRRHYLCYRCTFLVHYAQAEQKICV
jgi:hypothetical protein